jgi:hypothetical protein
MAKTHKAAPLGRLFFFHFREFLISKLPVLCYNIDSKEV